MGQGQSCDEYDAMRGGLDGVYGSTKRLTQFDGSAMNTRRLVSNRVPVYELQNMLPRNCPQILHSDGRVRSACTKEGMSGRKERCCNSCKNGGACISKERFQASHCCNSCRRGGPCMGTEKFVSGSNACHCQPGRCDCNGNMPINRVASLFGTQVPSLLPSALERSPKTSEPFVSMRGTCDEGCVKGTTPAKERFNSAYYSRLHGHHQMRGNVGRTHWGLPSEPVDGRITRSDRRVDEIHHTATDYARLHNIGKLTDAGKLTRIPGTGTDVSEADLKRGIVSNDAVRHIVDMNPNAPAVRNIVNNAVADVKNDAARYDAIRTKQQAIKLGVEPYDAAPSGLLPLNDDLDDPSHAMDARILDIYVDGNRAGDPKFNPGVTTVVPMNPQVNLTRSGNSRYWGKAQRTPFLNPNGWVL